MNCIECGNPVDLKEGDEIPGVGIISGSVTNICRACLSKGWSEATAEDFIKDPSFTVLYESPIQREDLYP